jgi:hypothetical protein
MMVAVVGGVLVAAIAGGAFVLNEWTSGMLGESLGFGHHHLTQDRHAPCDGTPHVHGAGAAPHADCARMASVPGSVGP